MLDRFEMISFGEGCFSEDPDVVQLYDDFVTRLGKQKDNIWYDKVDGKVFGLGMNYTNNDNYAETLYLNSEENFLTDKRHGVPHFQNVISTQYKSNELDIKNDIIIEKHAENQKYKGSTILIIGAGPSTNMVNIDEIDRDYTWVCNDFLNNEKVKNLDVSIFYMSNHTYLRHREKQYLLENPSVTACFDINVARDYRLLEEYRVKTSGRAFIFSTRLFTTNGTVPRLVSLAAHLGASKIKVVGLDGHTEEHFLEGKSLTSFEKTKKSIPTGQTYGSQCREYLLFWEHMVSRHPQVEIQNLSSVYEDNVSNKIMETVTKWVKTR